MRYQATQASTSVVQADSRCADPAFRAWFADSVAVDESGEPARFYRGWSTPSFKPVSAMCFATTPEIASVYAATKRSDGYGSSIASWSVGAQVAACHLRLTKPLRFEPYATEVALDTVARRLGWGSAGGITDEECLKIITYLGNRESGKVEGPGFKVTVDHPSITDDLELWSLTDTRGPVARLSSEVREGFIPMGEALESVRCDLYAVLDSPRIPVVAGRLGYDGVIHPDLAGALVTAAGQLGLGEGDAVPGVSGRRAGAVIETWRVFAADQAWSCTGWSPLPPRPVRGRV